MKRLTRRGALIGGVTTLGVLAGCTDLIGDGGPQTRSYDVTIVERDGSLAADVTPQTAPGVIQVNVNDDVTLHIENDLEEAIGVHNHVTDEETILSPGETHTMTFTPTDTVVGRHDLEAFRAPDEHDGGGENQSDHDDDSHGNESDHDEEDDDDHDRHGEGRAVLVIEVRPAGS